MKKMKKEKKIENWEKELKNVVKAGELRKLPQNWIKKIPKGKMSKAVGYCELGLYLELVPFIRQLLAQEKKKWEKEKINEILTKLEIEIHGRDITIYELGDWLNKKLTQLQRGQGRAKIERVKR